MKVNKTSLKDVFVIEPNIIKDDRGYFMESYKDSWFKKRFQNINFIQDNESKSAIGTIRGLHYQKPPFSQTKLVRVIYGSVLDVVVDLRKNSTTYGKYEEFNLNSELKHQLLVPKGFAHGFQVLSEIAIFSYKVDQYYKKEYDDGIYALDKELGINWRNLNPILSKKDLNLQRFNQFKSPFE